MKDPINLVLFGERGVGKSSLVNLFANLLAYDSFEAAQQGELKCPVPLSFTIIDEKYQVQEIKVGCEPTSNHSDPQELNSYCFEATFSGEVRHLNIIDMPGISDNRFIEQDRKNLEQVIEYINQFEGLNAICLVLRPNDSRLGHRFLMFLQALLLGLDRSSASNICFCYTNSRRTFFHPGESCDLVKTQIARLATVTEVVIPFDQSNTFYFDSEPFRYMAAKEKGTTFDALEVDCFKESWDRSAQALKRLLSYFGCERPSRHE